MEWKEIATPVLFTSGQAVPTKWQYPLIDFLGSVVYLQWHPMLLDLQGFEFQPMPKLTEVCFHHPMDRTPMDPSLIPQIRQVFHRKLPFVNTVLSEDSFADDYGIAVPDVEK